MTIIAQRDIEGNWCDLKNGIRKNKNRIRGALKNIAPLELN